MRLNEIEFGSLLSYSPRGDSEEIRHSKDVRTFLKADRFVENPDSGSPPILMSEWIAQMIERNKVDLPSVDSFKMGQS